MAPSASSALKNLARNLHIDPIIPSIMRRIHLSLLALVAALALSTSLAHAQRASIASEKDYQTGEQIPFVLLQVDEAGLNRALAAMKGRDGDFENLRETLMWQGFTLPNMVGAIDLQVTQGVWLMKKGEGKFTPLPKLRPLKEGESYALKVKALDNEGVDLLEDKDRTDSLLEYLEQVAKE